MTDSLTPGQRDEVQRLGAWRDEGHLLAVGRFGKVSTHPADKGDNDVATEQREGAARRQGPSGRQRAAGSRGAAAPPEPACEDGSPDVRAAYLASMPEIREYYPDLRVIEVEDGIWVVTQILPIGRDGPFFTICLFLHDDKAMDAKAFAFKSDGRHAIPAAERHTNFPDRSICAFCADDAVWRPGESPHILLNLYAEWLVCQLFFEQEGHWPGRQFGPNASYRVQEFRAPEWCHCGSAAQYGNCHMESDRREVARLKELKRYEPLARRTLPPAVKEFAKSGWKHAPLGAELFPHPFRERDEALQEIRARKVQDCAVLLGLAESGSKPTWRSRKAKLLSGRGR